MAKKKRKLPPPRPAAAAAPARPESRWIGIALIVVTLIVYWRATSLGFVTFDDNDYIYENETVLRGLTADGIAWAFGGAHFGNWHPLTWMSHMLDASFFGADPGKHHFTSVALHAISAWILFAALSRLTGAVWPSAVVAALFALHPLHVESVAWLSERKDVLSGLLWNLSLLAYVRWIAQRTRGRYAALLIVFAAALLAKQMVVTLPFVLLLLDWWPLRRIVDAASFRRALTEKLPMIAMSAVASVVIFLAQRKDAVVALSAIPLPLRLENAALSYMRYLGRMVWPTSLAVFYPYRQNISPAMAGLALLGIAAITVLAWLLRTKRPYLLLGWLWYLGTLVPVIGIVQVGQQSHADRYTYLPLVGIFIAGVWWIYDLAATKPGALRAAAAATAAVLLVLAAVTWHQLGYWRDGETLFAHAIAVTGDNAVAECDLGMALNLQRRSGEAVQHFERAVQIEPKYVDAWANLGNALARNGRVDEAVRAWEQALRYNSRLPDVRNNLGVAYMRSRQLGAAVDQFKRAVEVDPRYVPALLNLGRVTALDDPAAARPYYERVLLIDPSNDEAARALGRRP